ncbi:MAG: DUF2330 domain-containing protein [Myxococcota bacterium]
MFRTVTTLSRLGLATVAASALVLQLASPPEAEACGGFFCSQSPIDQLGEQILFSVEPGEIKATVQISYEGEAHEFAWVIPVSSKPVITVTPAAVFTALRGMTEPQYWLQWEDSDTCNMWRFYPQAAANDGGSPTGGGGGGVTVLETAEVGPYQTATVQSDDPQALFEWLDKNGYDQPQSALPYIEHYVSSGMLFVALKLKANADVGDLQPVTFTFTQGDPCVPLILTRVAAAPDMPVRIFVLGDSRAVPTNWMHVVINQMKIDWIGSGGFGFGGGNGNYEEVVTQAVNEAAGRAFVTEYAGASSALAEALWREGQFDTAKLAAAQSAPAFINEMLSQGFPRDGQVQNLIKTYIPRPDDADLPEDCRGDQSFYATWNMEHCLTFMPESWSFEAASFALALEDAVVTPLRDTQKLIDRMPYLTRLFTTVSPDEMTRDPIFSFNPDLPEVSNIHQATGKATCDEEGNILTATITLETGESYTIKPPKDIWNGLPPELLPAGPFAARIELVGESGAPVTVAAADAKTIDQRLDRETPQSVLGNPGAAVTNPTPGVSGGPTGCQGSELPVAPLAAMAALLALAITRRRA